MLKWSYMAMLLFTICGSFWLEIVLKVGVLKRIYRVILSILPVAIPFIIWDAYAVSNKHWSFDSKQILGIYGPFKIPLEEFLFFIIVPIAAIMTIEGVRAVKKHWPVGDEKE
ncbi:MAG: lycopene cyclase domain-containing protein [Actinobacteria bacterium]|nr:lycopene cyclase domain-containing protein [Actinomycetota bacterium]